MSIKITRALKVAGIANVPSMATAIRDAVPTSIVAALSSSQLAELYIALNRHWGLAIAHAEREAIVNGAVWDGKTGHLRDIHPVNVMTPDDLKSIRKSKAMTQTDLANTLDISLRQVMRYESGEAPIPHLVNLACRSLG